MALRDLQLLEQLLTKITAPLLCDNYVQLYPLYLETIKHVTSLFANVDLLSDNRGFNPRLDDNVVNSLVVLLLQEARKQLSTLNGVDTSNSSFVCDSFDTNVVNNHSLSNDKSSKSSNVSGLVAEPVQGNKKKRKKKKSKVKSSNVGLTNLSRVDVSGSVSSPDTCITDLGVVASEGEKSNNCGSGFPCGRCSSGVCTCVTTVTRGNFEAEVTKQFLDSDSGLDFDSSDTGSCFRSEATTKGDLGVSSKRRAQDSLWKLRHFKNCLSIREVQKKLDSVSSSGSESSEQLKLANELTKRNIDLQKQLREVKKDKVKLQQALISTRRLSS